MRKIDRKEVHAQFGAYIMKARKQMKKSQSEVAALVGVSQSYYSRMESGEREIDLPIALKLCDVLELDINDFVKMYM